MGKMSPFLRGLMIGPRLQKKTMLQCIPLPWRLVLGDSCVRVRVCVCVFVTQLCPTLCKPMGQSLPGSSVYGILQARILEWMAIPFSRTSSQARDWTQFSHTAGRFFTVWATREVQGNSCYTAKGQGLIRDSHEAQPRLKAQPRWAEVLGYYLICTFLPFTGKPLKKSSWKVWKDSTCRGATKPICQNYWAHTLESKNRNYWTHVSRARASQQEKPLQWLKWLQARPPQCRVAPAQCN